MAIKYTRICLICNDTFETAVFRQASCPACRRIAISMSRSEQNILNNLDDDILDDVDARNTARCEGLPVLSGEWDDTVRAFEDGRDIIDEVLLLA